MYCFSYFEECFCLLLNAIIESNFTELQEFLFLYDNASVSSVYLNSLKALVNIYNPAIHRLNCEHSLNRTNIETM